VGRIPGVVLAAATATALLTSLLTSLLTGCVGQAADPAALASHPSVTGVGDPYFPMDGNAGIDVERYRIRDAYQFESGRLSGRTTLAITATKRLPKFSLDFLLPVSKVRLSTGGATYSQQTKHELVITPAKAIAAGQRFKATVTYAGVPGDDSSAAHRRGHRRGQPYQIARCELDVEPPSPCADEDGVPLKCRRVHHGRKPPTLPEGTDPPDDVSGRPLGGRGLRHHRSLAAGGRGECLQVKAAVDGHDGDREGAVDVGQQCLEHLRRVQAQRLRRLHAERQPPPARPRVVLVGP